MSKQYRKASHCVYDLKYHLVWITKYRKPVLRREIGTRVRDLIRMICASLDVEIVKGNISRDHVHLLVSVPPTLAVSRLVQRMKGLTSRKLLMENRGLNKAFWVAPSKLGKGGGTTELKPFSVTLRVSNPTWQSVAAARSESCMVRGDPDREAWTAIAEAV